MTIIHPFQKCKNKAKQSQTKPIQSQSNPIQTQNKAKANPIQSQTNPIFLAPKPAGFMIAALRPSTEIFKNWRTGLEGCGFAEVFCKMGGAAAMAALKLGVFGHPLILLRVGSFKALRYEIT